MLFGFVVFVYGLNWGLPDKEHFHHSFHPDETASIESSLQILLSGKPLYPSPTALGNGAMQFYLVALVYQIVYGAGLKTMVTMMNSTNLSSLYLTGRIITVIMGLGAAIIIFLTTRKMHGQRGALIASLLFVSIPGTVVNSHYFRPDIPAAFWLVLSFLMAVLILESGKLKYYVLAGVFAGFAASTKYNSVLIFLPLIIGHIMRKSSDVKTKKFASYFDKNIFIALFVGLVAFFVGSPGVILYWDEFWQRLVKQWSYQTSATLMESMERGPGWIGYFTHILPYALGIPLLGLSILGIVYACWRHTKFDIMTLAWLVPYYLLLGSSNWWVVRYTTGFMPFLAILDARLLADFYTKTRGFLRYFVTGVGVVVVVYTMLFSFELDRIMAAKDPRIIAYDWIDKNIEPSQTIGFDFTPAAFFQPINFQKYKAINMRMDKANLNLIDYYVANDQVYLQYLRLQKPFSAANYFREIFSGGRFIELVRFENRCRFSILNSSKADLPHDYLYFMPTITIFGKLPKSPDQNKEQKK